MRKGCKMDSLDVPQHRAFVPSRAIPFKASGRGALHIGTRQFDSIDYFVTTVNNLEPEIIGFIFCDTDEGGVLASLRGKSGILCLRGAHRLLVQFSEEDYLHVGTVSPICLFFTADALLASTTPV